MTAFLERDAPAQEFGPVLVGDFRAVADKHAHTEASPSTAAANTAFTGSEHYEILSFEFVLIFHLYN